MAPPAPALLLGFAALCTAASSAAPPNLLLLFPDQWRHDWTPLNPALPALSMPTFAALLSQGTHFPYATVPSPLCAPSRACLVSGREYDEAGVPDNFTRDYPLNQTTFYTLLREAGYHVMTSGKDDLTKASGPGLDGSFHAAALGFSAWARAAGKQDAVNRGAPFEPYGVYCAARNTTVDGRVESLWDVLRGDLAHSCTAAAAMPGGYDCSTASPMPQFAYEDDYVAANALALLAARPAGAPWLLHVSFPGPHPPFVATAGMLNATRSDDFPLAVNNTATPAAAQLGARRAYAAELENLDALFARVLAGVAAADAADGSTTLIVVASDHGEMLGDLGDWGKTMPWQGSASVPLLFVGPALGVRAGAAVAAPVTTLDIAGTLLDFAGVARAPGMTTQSLRPALVAGAPPARATVSSGLASWRAVLDTPPANASAIFKLVCCRGPCPGGDGAPFVGGDARDYAGVVGGGAAAGAGAAAGGAGGARATAGDSAAFVAQLFDVVADPFDRFDIAAAHPQAVVRMKALLPPGWCGSSGGGRA